MGVLFEKMGSTCSILLMNLIFIVGYVGELQIPVGFGIGMGSTLIPSLLQLAAPQRLGEQLSKSNKKSLHLVD